MRVAGAFDGFEIAVRAIAMRQWPLAEARAWLRRFAEQFGVPVRQAPEGVRCAFATADVLAQVPPDTLRATGLSARGTSLLLTLASDIAARRVCLEPLTALDETLAYLRTVAGFDEWSTQYIAMRALGWPNAFPVGDPLTAPGMASTTPAILNDVAPQWAPWRAYAAQHLALAPEEKANAA
jgi:AraC family transcriptional regulator of adaptative response / DNA-3-methyladenine glycosylase II